MAATHCKASPLAAITDGHFKAACHSKVSIKQLSVTSCLSRKCQLQPSMATSMSLRCSVALGAATTLRRILPVPLVGEGDFFGSCCTPLTATTMFLAMPTLC